MKTIGIVGLGVMGRGMLSNFLKNGYTVFVWNRTRSVSQEFAVKGAVICETPSEVAQRADVVFEVTVNDESSKEVWLGENGITKGADKNTTLIASATLSIEWIDELVEKCKALGLPFMDVALTGSRAGAEGGTMTLLCGGDEKTLSDMQSVFKAIATKVFHFGVAGQGMRYKLILNFLQAVHVVGFGQGMRIAKAYSMDLNKVSEALADRPGGVITGVARNAYFEDPDPVSFPIDWIIKDLTYAKKFAKDLDVGVLDAVLAEYMKAAQKGLSKKDWATVGKLL